MVPWYMQLWAGYAFLGSIKLHVSFAEYGLFYRALLQKRPIILSILRSEATPCRHQANVLCVRYVVCILSHHRSLLQKSPIKETIVIIHCATYMVTCYGEPMNMVCILTHHVY